MNAESGSTLTISDNLRVDTSGFFLCSGDATVNFTSAEAKILIALVDAGKAGLSIGDTLAMFGNEISCRSLHIVRTHISKIRKKIALFGKDKILLEWNKDRQKYLLIAPGLRRTYLC